MKKGYYQIARENWRMILGNPLVWVFGLFATASNVFTSPALQSDDLGLRCVLAIGSLFSLAIGVIGAAGLIHIADHIPRGPAPMFREVWKRSVGSAPRIFAVYLIFGLVFAVPYVVFGFVFGFESIWWLAWVTLPVGTVIGMLSACGIVITGLGVSDSLTNGVRVFGRHIVDMLLLGVAYFALPAIVTIGGFLVLKSVHLDMNVPSPIPITPQTYSELLRIPAISVIGSITYFVIVPLWTILIALAYKEYGGKRSPSTRKVGRKAGWRRSKPGRKARKR
jgi:hypothetical protein